MLEIRAIPAGREVSRYRAAMVYEASLKTMELRFYRGDLNISIALDRTISASHFDVAKNAMMMCDLEREISFPVDRLEAYPT